MGNLDSLLDSFTPKYRWRFDDLSSPNLDSGSATTDVDLAEVGTLLYNQAGPDGGTKAVDFSGANNWGTSANPVLGGASGSVVCIYNLDGAASHFGTILLCDSADETNMIDFGFGAAGFGGSKLKPTVAFFSSIANRRVLRTTTDILDIDSEWHSLVFTHDGTSAGHKIYYDGAIQTTEYTVAGSPPGDDSWFETNITPTRTAVGNHRFVSANANLDALLSQTCVYTTELTADDALAIHNAVQGIHDVANNAIRMVSLRNARGGQ